jgi:hypothetical protein
MGLKVSICVAPPDKNKYMTAVSLSLLVSAKDIFPFVKVMPRAEVLAKKSLLFII